jgi:enterochelin esterase-like enzyme
VYLPPGYETDTERRYPVIYEAPSGFSSWERGAHFVETLDGLIDGGVMPPTIVVFASNQGSPYVDGECANSYDGREQLDTYYSSTLVSWTDANLRTIRSPDARTFLGYSEGGYCAAVLVMRHPSVFHQDISLSGYYQGGIVSNQTVNAWRPFDKNPALLATYSPDVLASKIDAALRREMFVILSGTPTEAFYGPQLTNFGDELRALGFPVEVLDVTSYGHSWPGMRTVVPYALELLGEREAERGVFR